MALCKGGFTRPSFCFCRGTTHRALIRFFCPCRARTSVLRISVTPRASLGLILQHHPSFRSVAQACGPEEPLFLTSLLHYFLVLPYPPANKPFIFTFTNFNSVVYSVCFCGTIPPVPGALMRPRHSALQTALQNCTRKVCLSNPFMFIELHTLCAQRGHSQLPCSQSFAHSFP
jgi:hypothetical protein